MKKNHRFPKGNTCTSYSPSAVGTVMVEWLPEGIKPDSHPFNRIKASLAPWQGCCVCMGSVPLVHLPSTYIWLELGLGFVNPIP